MEGAAHANPGLDGDIAAMGQEDGATQGLAQALALPGPDILGGEIGVEDPGQSFRRNATARILNAQAQVGPWSQGRGFIPGKYGPDLGCDHQGPALWHCLPGIVDQNPQGHPQGHPQG